jgi:hypothetical protein
MPSMLGIRRLTMSAMFGCGRREDEAKALQRSLPDNALK